MQNFLASYAPSIRRWGLLAIVVLVPLAFLRTTNSAFGVPKLAILLVLVPPLVALRIGERLAGRSASGLRRLAVPAGAVAAAMTIGWLFSDYRGLGVFGHYDRFTGLLPYLLTIAVGALTAEEFADDLTPIAWAFVTAGAVSALYGTIQVLGLDPFQWSLTYFENNTAAGTLGNPNFAGGFLAMSLPLVVALWLREPDRRLLTAALALVIVSGWVATGSQGAWAAGLAGLATTCGALAANRWRPSRWIGLTVAGGLVAVLIGVVIAGYVAPTSDVIPSEAKSRGWLWEAAVVSFAESPILGSGPSSYMIEGVENRTPEHATQNYVYADDPHSVFLSFVVSAGVVGGVAFVVVVIWAVRTGMIVAPGAVMRAAFFGSAIAYLAQSLVSIDNTPLRTGGWIVLGCLATRSSTPSVQSRTARGGRKTKSKGKQTPSRNNAPGAVAVLIVGILCSAYGVRFLGADLRFNHAQDALQEGEVNRAETAYEDAMALRNDVHYQSRYGLAMGAVAVRLVKEGHEHPAKAYLEKARHGFSFIDGTPLAGAVIDYARILRDFGDAEPPTKVESLELFEQAMELDPLNPLLRVETANVLMQLGRPSEALATLERLLDVINDLPPFLQDRVHYGYWEMLSDVRAELGDKIGARAAREEAERLETLQTGG